MFKSALISIAGCGGCFIRSFITAISHSIGVIKTFLKLLMQNIPCDTMAIGKIGRYIGSALMGAAAFIAVEGAATKEANAALVPWDYTQRIESDWSNLNKIVNTPSDNASYVLNQSNGIVTYASNGDFVPAGTLIFYDKADRQIVGEFAIDLKDPGFYDLRVGGYGMFADVEDTAIDDGWMPGHEAGVLLMAPGGKFFDAAFTRPLIFDGGEQQIGRYDVLVTDTQVPEPSMLALLGISSLAALTGRPRTPK